MLAALVIWSCYVILFHLYGSVLLQGLCGLLKIEVDGAVDPSLTVLAGLVVVTTLAMVVHLFLPLGAVFAAGLASGAVTIFVYRTRRPFPVSIPSLPPILWGLLALLVAIVLETATRVPANLDTGLYHAQTIRWFETYRIVPGLGNLQLRYAFNSSWLVLNAGLSLAFLGLRSFHLLNGAVFLLASFYFVSGLGVLKRNRTPASSFMKLMFLPLSLYLLSSDMSSVGNDMPVTLIIWIVMTLWVENLESRVNAGPRRLVIFLLAAFAVTVKLSSLPLLLLALLLVLEYAFKRDRLTVLVLCAVGAAILLAWSARSVILSGYPVFPQLQIDIFTVDWKMPADQVRLAIDGIVGLARIGNSWRPSMEMDFWQWVPRWFSRLTLNRQLILLLVLLSPALLLWGQRKYPSVVSRSYGMAFGAAFAGSMFWFLTAPDIRFGYGFLIAICALTLAPFLGDWFDRMKKKIYPLPTLVFVSLLLFQTYILAFSIEPDTLNNRLLLPADYLPSNAQSCKFPNGVEIHCRPDGVPWMECYYDLFPCIPVHRPTAEMRGPTFQDGFRSIPESAP